MTAAAPSIAAPPARGLDAIARTRGLRFGSATAWSAPGADRGGIGNPRYTALLERDCGILVAENEMKWQRLRPTPATFDFERADAIVALAKAKGMAMRGHTLLWHQTKWMPRWEATHDFGPRPATAGAAMLTQHIQTVIARYAPQVASWDVVNEAVNPNGSGLYETALSRAIGGAEPTLDLAFRTARAAAPGAQLVYNDYMSWEPGNDAHRAGVLKLLEGFRKRGTPVDALGLQSHLVTQGTAGGIAGQQAEWRRFLDAVTGMGYKLVVTEFDVRDNRLPADPAIRDRGVADYARAYLDVTLSYRQLRDVLAWGLSDRYSWIEGFEPRGDKARRRPTLYDRDFRPKPLYGAVAAALTAAPER
ncbi:glycosyl hydrolase [Sphingomonas spermidinifaciens]|uniref:Beta-xylanase n=2 Tax=Sphingomonas spermidinifaciens TaxID=1141889 RepID=A0A2A4B474_9SPHN|nr:glycosyl hydrolase [Sphingomonas spermidinifaciens]